MKGVRNERKILYDKVVTCAQAAASASQTKLTYRLNTAIWNTIGNKAGAELVYDNMQALGPPTVSAEDVEFAKALQHELGRPDVGLPQTIVPLQPPNPTFLGGPSSDVGDVSWNTPRIGFFAAIWPPGIPSTTGLPPRAPSATSLTRVCSLRPAIWRRPRSTWSMQPELLAAVRAEFMPSARRRRVEEPAPGRPAAARLRTPRWFLVARPGSNGRTPGITWPVERIIAHEHLGTVGPPLPPIT